MRLAPMLLALSLFSASASAVAGPTARTIEWTIGEQAFSGVLVYDDADDEPRPGLVMVPNWMGVTDSAVEKAKAIAGDDYVVLVVDMFGKGVRPADAEEALAQVRKLYPDPETMRERIVRAVDVLKSQAQAPLRTDRIGGVGFCFGGSTVLELARSGADVAGVVSLHGGLKSWAPVAEPGVVKAPILVLNGAADTAVPQEEILAFGEEMDAAGADWQFVNFSGAHHCFAEADADRPPNCLYDERAARRAYRMMEGFFDEVFGD